MPNKTLANRYVVKEEIGRGLLATVWRATDQVLQREVAVKILHPRLSVDDNFRERFQLEALAAAKLVHPNILSVFDTGEIDNLLFVVMEHAQTNLRAVMDSTESNQFDPQDGRAIARLGAAVCSALAYAHSEGAIHSDIKPTNILFPEGGVAKLGDFGLGRASAQSATTVATSKLTTIEYLSPEQVAGNPIDARSDIYSLGCVLYEAICGKPPFPGNDLAAASARLETDPVPIQSINPEVPKSLADTVMRALERNPEERFASADEMRLRLIEEFDESEPVYADTGGARVPLPPSPSMESTSFVKSEGRWLATAILVILAAGALVFGVVRYGEQVVESVKQSIAGPAEPRNRIEIKNISIYDPKGDEDSGSKNPQRAMDGKADTEWETQHYRTANFGRLKDGVGVVFDLGNAQELARISVTTSTPGWVASIRYSENGTSWTDISGSSSEVGAEHDFKFEDSGKHRYWMVWITRLARTSDDPPFAASISEVSVYAG